VGRVERPAPTAAPGCIAALVGLAVVFGGLAALFVKVGNALDHVGSGLSFPNLSRPEVHPIPIPRAACPSLRTVHDTAAQSEHLYLSALDASAPNGDKKSEQSWPSFRASFLLTLAGFDGALRQAVPEVPPRVAAQLTTVLNNVHVGETELGAASSYSEYTRSTFGNVLGGYGALGTAGHLVGNACGFALAP